MSNYFEDKYSSFEYNPCIRKGKHKPKHKKQKKYESKIQKMNSIQSIRNKLIINNYDTMNISNDVYNELIDILVRKDVTLWNDDYDILYNKLCVLQNNKTIEQGYIYINQYIEKQKTYEQKDYDKYDKYDEYDEYKDYIVCNFKDFEEYSDYKYY